jgi:hypothetical protein
MKQSPSEKVAFKKQSTFITNLAAVGGSVHFPRFAADENGQMWTHRVNAVRKTRVHPEFFGL